MLVVPGWSRVDEIGYKNPLRPSLRPCPCRTRARSCDGGPHILRHASHDDAMGRDSPARSSPRRSLGFLAHRPWCDRTETWAIAAFNLEASTAIWSVHVNFLLTAEVGERLARKAATPSAKSSVCGEGYRRALDRRVSIFTFSRVDHCLDHLDGQRAPLGDIGRSALARASPRPSRIHLIDEAKRQPSAGKIAPVRAMRRTTEAPKRRTSLCVPDQPVVQGAHAETRPQVAPT